MKTEDQLLELGDAALFLKTSKALLRDLADRGEVPCIKTREGSRSRYQFRMGDLAAGRKKRKAPHLTDVRAVAEESLARVAHLEGVVAELLNVLGMKQTVLPTSVEAIKELHDAVQELLAEDPIQLPYTPLQEWAARFLAVTEEFLTHYCRTLEEPYAWRTLLELATRIEIESAPTTTDGPGKEAYSFLQAGRRSLRAVCYFYAEKAHGETVSKKLTKRGEDLNSIVLRHLRMS